ncbi:uncharacterized protein LOC115430105 [Sphaeramia orbicularis]|uniref:uncharacterized protein LOC115430105 n=1 Tax=Sphaeramia orbicularis TaxID=375764 RepID=UPI00117D342E|nr:uncharacterized protein LOC115430105 [Sphaeramia orbicularis]
MALKLMGNTVPDQGGRKDVVVDVDESVLILIRHCRDMKRQETCLRFITLLLLLSCTTLFVLTLSADFKKCEEFGSSGHKDTLQQSPAHAQLISERCPDNHQTNLSTMRVHFWSVPVKDKTDKLYMEWSPMLGENYIYNKDKQAIVIRQQGFYFLYVRVGLGCQQRENVERKFHMKLHKWTESYNKSQVLTEAWDGVQCSSEVSKNMFVGQLFELREGDHVSVWVEDGYQLITRASLGGFLT